MQEELIRSTGTRRARWAVGIAVVAVSAGLLAGCAQDPTGRDRGRAAENEPSTSAPEAAPAPSPIAPADPSDAKSGKGGDTEPDTAQDKASTKPGAPAKTPRGGQSEAANEDPQGWKTLWRDDFDDLDQKRWNVRNRGEAPNQKALFMRDNVSLSDGLLRLQAKKQKAKGWNGTWDYTSGYVDTNGKFALPDTFRLEVRAKVPFERGLWPAPMWLRPSDQSSGEIDLIETFGREVDEPATHHTVHTAYGPGRRQDVEVKKYSELPGSATGWHTYTMEKTEGEIRMWVDGVRTATFKSGSPSWFDRYYAPDKKWNLRVNLNVGGDWNGMPDGSTDWSSSEATMYLDYVQAYVPD